MMNPFVYKGIHQTVKAKVVNLLQERLEAQNAFDESSDMHESEDLDELFDFLCKTSNCTCRDSAQ